LQKSDESALAKRLERRNTRLRKNRRLLREVQEKVKRTVLLLAFSVAFLSAASAPQNYMAEKLSDHGVDIVRLTDAASGVEVAIAPSLGNRLYEMKVHGKDVLNSAPDDVSDFQKRVEFGGIPFLAPWANRLSEEDFWANGKKYIFNMTLGNVRAPLPTHGLVRDSPFWEVTEVKADKHSSHITSRFRFWRYPDLMAQWPFAQEYEMTYQLSKGVLETRLVVSNLSADPMPIVVGFHPCFRIPDVDREEWTATLAARKIAIGDGHVVATGELKPLDLPNPFPLKGQALDTGLTDLARDAAGRAHFSIESGGKKVEVLFGPGYPVAEFFVPRLRNPANSRLDSAAQTVCIEPMAGLTNAVNLYHDGKYPGLQILSPGANWRESFWIRASGI
jgi:aldose 1-epimerase